MATVYAIASAKGGVGKTTTAASIATLLADGSEAVVAIDADLGMANLAGALGITVKGETIHDVLAGRADPEDAAQEGPHGLRVLPGQTDLDAYAEADPARLGDVVDAFDDADYVILDAGAGLSHDSALPLGIADRTLLVSTPEREALRDTAKTGELTDRLGGRVDGAVITRVDPDDPHGHDDLIVSHLDVPIHERIPEDDAVATAVTASEPLVTFAPTAPATRAYRTLTEQLTGVSIPDPEPTESTAVEEMVESAAVGDTSESTTSGETSDPDPGIDADGSTPEPADGSTPDVEMTTGDLTDRDRERGTRDVDADGEIIGQQDPPTIRDAEGDAVDDAPGTDGADEADTVDEPDTVDEADTADEASETDEADTADKVDTADDADDERGRESTVDATADVDTDTDTDVGSVPFRDDDGREPERGANTAAEDGASDTNRVAAHTGGEADVDGSTVNDDRSRSEDGADDDEDDDRGFFGRLFGR
ncbi:septum site-determining protein MinD [Halopenitus malekzadehii]|uniref:Septum site-determining protein MinD n=1 Tax=Halopenitus malekzadehii TaxID=1267564 RepID=A0A1H6HT68_9EURY|nr:AAA family ATPase [Halopenitus malekzadehii]SEH37344.1 septum site-determining protein MinD [Halopenitus malekzadehii]